MFLSDAHLNVIPNKPVFTYTTLWLKNTYITKGTPGIKRPGCEADYPPLSSPEVKSTWSYTSTPLVRLHGVVLG